MLQVLSSTNGDLLADEIVNDNPNPQLATPVDVEIVEETKYDLTTLSDGLTARCFIKRHPFYVFHNSVKWRLIYTKFLADVVERMLIQNISTKYGC